MRLLSETSTSSYSELTASCPSMTLCRVSQRCSTMCSWRRSRRFARSTTWRKSISWSWTRVTDTRKKWTSASDGISQKAPLKNWTTWILPTSMHSSCRRSKPSKRKKGRIFLGFLRESETKTQKAIKVEESPSSSLRTTGESSSSRTY